MKYLHTFFSKLAGALLIFLFMAAASIMTGTYLLIGVVALAALLGAATILMFIPNGQPFSGALFLLFVALVFNFFVKEN